MEQQLNKKPIVVIAGVIRKDSRIFVARRKAGKSLAGMWEFPGGKLEAYESHEECLAREIFEELNMKILVGEFIGKNIYQYPNFAIELHAYEAKYTSGEISLTDHDEFNWLSKEEIKNLNLAPADIPFLELIK